MRRNDDAAMQDKARKLGLWGLLANWAELGHQDWVREYLGVEEDERQRRSLERRVRNARLGRFKSLADFDWDWPKQIDRDLVDDLVGLDFLSEHANVVIIGPNGVGKTTLAQNIAYQALLAGHTVRHTVASDMLRDLAAQDSSSAFGRRLRRYCSPALLVLDELGFLSYDTRYGDLLFEVISRRHENRSTIVTTNRPFSEWIEIFSNASCVTALVDRLLHRAEIVSIEADSYREKEAHERVANRQRARRERGRTKKAKE